MGPPWAGVGQCRGRSVRPWQPTTATTPQRVLLSLFSGHAAVWGVFRKAIGRWRLFKEIEPGHRFQARYHSHRRRREQGETSTWVRLFNLAGGPVLIVAGFAFLPTPGPSYIIIVLGVWMLSGEFLPLACLFDWVRVRLGKLAGWIKDHWSGLPAVVKIVAALACAAALGYGAYYLRFGS